MTITRELREYSARDLAKLLPHPAAEANKYSRGKLILTVGSAAYPGAACMAVTAAQRVGAGYTEAFTSAANVSLLQMYRPSCVVRSWDQWEAKTSLPAWDAKHPLAVLVGSGFDADDEQARRVLTRDLSMEAPLLVDGSALGMLASPVLMQLCDQRSHLGFPTVLTPHGGEAARLAQAAGISAADEGELAAMLAEAYHAVVALKGPDTIIADAWSTATMTRGTAALAKAGTGDVLAGIIGGLLAQGMDPFDAAMLGTTLHAEAANVAAAELGDIAVCPEDVLVAIPAALRLVEASGKPAMGFNLTERKDVR